MDLQGAVAAAKQQIEDSFAGEGPRDVRLETFLYDDHLMVWSLTIGFDLGNSTGQDRSHKVIRVSEANKIVLSIKDP